MVNKKGKKRKNKQAKWHWRDTWAKWKRSAVRRFARRYVLPVALSAISAWVLIFTVRRVPFLKTWFGLIANSNPEWFMQSYYNTVNGMETEPEVCPDIVILDLNEHITRQHIADLIQVLSASSPKVVGMDCVFDQSQSYDTAQTNYMISKLAQLPDTFPMVYAAIFGDESILPDSLMRNKGFVNFVGFYDFKAYSDGLPHLAVEMARVGGCDVEKIDTASFLVNYRTKDFQEVPIMTDFMEYADYIRESVEGKIVLIGGVSNRWDMHKAPFSIREEDSYISGSYIVAYALSSIWGATNDKKDLDPLYQSKNYHYYSRCTWWQNVLLTLLLMTIYLGGYTLINRWRRKYSWMVWFKPMLMLSMMILILVISMSLTTWCFVVPNVVAFTVMIAFVGFFYEVCKPTKK